jgi:hypothetical protein
MPHVLAAFVNLNHPGRYVHWGFIQLSLANLLVIGLMLLVFVLAIVLPFPHGRAARGAPPAQPGTTAVDLQPEDRSER